MNKLNYTITLTPREIITLHCAECEIDTFYKLSLLPSTRKYYKRLRNDLANIIDPMWNDLISQLAMREIMKGGE